MQTIPYFDRDDVQLYLGDCVALTKELQTNSVDLVVTSPPYDALRKYDGSAKEGWSFIHFEQLADELYRVVREGGVVVWNVSDQTKNGSESGSNFQQALRFMAAGFLLADTMIYKKANSGGARGSNKTYLQCFEYMFVFSKGKLGTFNLLTDRPNKRTGKQQGGGRRDVNGKVCDTVSYDSTSHGRRLNVWAYPTQTDEFSSQHPAPMPFDLALDHIKSWSNEGDLVLDPFCGSGTTLAAALGSARRAVGFELSRDYVEIARRRISSS